MCLSNPISRALDKSGICYDTSFIIWQEISIWGKITCFELNVVVLMLLCRNDPSDLLVWDWTVREITKSSSTFSATNISSNIVGLLQLHDTIRMKSSLVPDLVAFISQKEKNVCFFDYHLLTCSVRKMVLIGERQTPKKVLYLRSLMHPPYRLSL